MIKAKVKSKNRYEIKYSSKKGNIKRATNGITLIALIVTIIIDNCSNIGQIVISDNANIGEIVGQNSWTTFQNCYYNFQNGIDAIGVNIGGTLNNVIQTDNMPTVLSIIGSKFKEDTNNINNGYPVLNWQ